MLRKLLVPTFAIALSGAAFAQATDPTTAAAAPAAAPVAAASVAAAPVEAPAAAVATPAEPAAPLTTAKKHERKHPKGIDAEKADKIAEVFNHAPEKLSKIAHQLDTFCKDDTNKETCAKASISTAMSTELFKSALGTEPAKKEGKKGHHKAKAAE